MPTINQLTAVSTVQAGDLLPVFSTSNGDARKAAISVLQRYMQQNLTLTDPGAFAAYQTQYAAPAATGFSIQVSDNDDNTHLILTPVAGYAAGTIVLPLSSNLIDKQEFLFNATQDVTALTINGNGAMLFGIASPLGVTAGDYFRLKYDLPGNTWYRVG